jgi:L-ascorbate metabolism protein UlaG (beta-lactamase superfamily)
MKHLISFFLCGMIFSSATAQRAAADEIKTPKGPLTIQPVFHGGLVLTWDHKTIYIDPYGGAMAYKGLAAPDMILITDVHQDHLDTITLNALETGKATFIVPQAVADLLPTKYKQKTVVLNNGKSVNEKALVISAIPMYNLPEEKESKHPKGRGNGYLINLGGKTVYISGDTEDIPEMRALRNIDLAFVCMNLPYTMDINQAASAVIEFRPAIVYPYHYRGKDGLSDVEAFKKLVDAGGQKTEVRLRNWYAQ